MQRANYVLWGIVVLAGILALLIIGTYWEYVVFALLFAIVFYPLYRRLAGRMHRSIAAILIILLVLVALIVPTFMVITSTVKQAPKAYAGAVEMLQTAPVQRFLGFTGDEVQSFVNGVGQKLTTNIYANVGAYITQISDMLIGMFILFISLYFLLVDGKKFYALLLEQLPFRRTEAQAFFLQMRAIINAVLVGQIATAAVQGILGGILFFVFGIPNPLFWGVIMLLLSIIPMLGPFLVYVPAGAYLILGGNYVSGILLLALGVLVLSQIDNVVRTYIANRATRVHPLIVILGVIGGIKLWGLVGFILGPLVLAAFFALYEFAMTGNQSKIMVR